MLNLKPYRENDLMKLMKFCLVSALFVPTLVFGATNSDFQNAARLLSAARRGDTQTVQVLISSGVDINYTDATGLSLVCTAVMNNDTRAAQILQMYGADASKCDKQIKQYKNKVKVAARGEEYGFFSGLGSGQVLALSALGVVGVIAGVALLTDVFDADNNNSNPSSGGSHSGGNGGSSSGGGSSTSTLFALDLPYGPACSGKTCPTDFSVWEQMQDFDYMSDKSRGNFNYLMSSYAYNAFIRGYLGMQTIRIANDNSPFDLSSLPYTSVPGGGKPVNVAIVTETGVNATGSAVDGIIPWVDKSQITIVQSACANDSTSSACQTALANSIKLSHKYFNYTGDEAATDETTAFDLSGSGSVFGSATTEDTKLAKIIAGWEEGGRDTPDFYGFIPNGQLTVYKIGAGESGVSDYKNYAAINNALQLQNSGNYVSNVVANLALPASSSGLDYATVGTAKILNDAATTTTMQKSVFGGLIDRYYDLNTTDGPIVNEVATDAKPSDDANTAFTYLSNYQKQILVNSAGRNLYGLGSGMSLDAQIATFENFAPVVYGDLKNLFATVVAVKPTDGTSGESIPGYSAADAGKLQLAIWNDTNDSSVQYASRVCGLTGNGNGGTTNPWCFAAPGTTDLEATAAMAGSVALVKSAFDYMTPQEIFLLLALTADGPYLGTTPDTGLAWTSNDLLVSYLQDMYILPGDMNTNNSQYLENFKTAFGYGMINLERATRPGTNVYFYSSDKSTIVSSSGNAYWRKATASAMHASAALSLNSRQAIKTSAYDVIESSDGTISLPRVWNSEFALNNDYKHGLYIGDVLSDFNIDNNSTREVRNGNMTFAMSVSNRAYYDNMNGLDNMRVAFSNETLDIDATYQHYLTDGESRFSGRANAVLALATNAVSSNAMYKYGKLAFGARAFMGTVTDESLLESDPALSSQFQPGRLGMVNGGSMNARYDNDKFALDMSFGVMHEDNTVLGMYSDGLLKISGGNTQYIDANAVYKVSDNIKLSLHGTFANTTADANGGIISSVSNIKSNAFAFGADVGGLSLTIAAPLAAISGNAGYDYTEFSVVENGGKYEIAMSEPTTEYIDLAAQKRELRLSMSYKKSIGEFTDAGIGFIYRVNPNNIDTFGNESIMMLKLHHRIGI